MNALGVFLYDSVRRGRSSHRNAFNAKLPISGVVIHKGLFTAHEVNWINLQQVDPCSYTTRLLVTHKHQRHDFIGYRETSR